VQVSHLASAHPGILTDFTTVSHAGVATNEHAAPELTRSTRTSFSGAASESPNTPPQHAVPSGRQLYNPDGIYGCEYSVNHKSEQIPTLSPSTRSCSVDVDA
jgi:hypothetical protein